MKVIQLLAIVSIAVLSVQRAGAVTIGFDDIDDAYPPSRDPYYENGAKVTPTYGELASYRRPGSVHLDPWGTFYTAEIEVNLIDGSLFDAVSFDILPVGSWPGIEYELVNYETGDLIDSSVQLETGFNNVSVMGYRDGVQLTAAEFSMDDGVTITLDRTFSNLDVLAIGILEPDLSSLLSPYIQSYLDDGYTLTAASCSDMNPCSHFDLDNIIVNPVPLPGTLILMGSAISALGFKWPSRKRKRHEPKSA